MHQAIPTGKCWCGCGEQTKPGKFFVQTHDGKAYGYLRKLHIGRYGNDGLANILLAMGYDDENGVRSAAKQKMQGPRSLRRRNSHGIIHSLGC